MSSIRRTPRGTRLYVLAIAGATWLVAGRAAAQSAEDLPAAAGGATLGAVSGITLGLVGGLGTCSRVLRGTRCARVAAGLGGAIGVTSGALIGYHTPGPLGNRLGGVGIGAVVGAAVGLAVRTRIPQYRWIDVLATAAVGGAVGSAPVGAGIGFGAGLALGGILWLAAPGEGLPEAVATALTGLAIGGLADWAAGAARSFGDAGRANANATALVIPISIRF